MHDLLVIGVGNPWRHDDGIGPKIIEILRTRSNLNYDLYDGATDGLALLDEIQKYPRVLIVDAVNMGAESGTVRLFTPEEAEIKIHSDTLSTHGFGISEVIKFVEELKITSKLKIIGIQPRDVSFGEGLSAEVANQIGSILEMIDKVNWRA